MKFRICAVVMFTALSLLSAPPAFGQSLDLVKQPARSVPELLRDANQAHQKEDHRAFRDALEALHRQRPNNSGYMYQLVLAYALLDEKRSAYNMMLKMQRQGLAYDFDQAPEAENIRGTQIYSYLNDLMKGAGQPVGEAEAIVTLDKDITWPEAIAWDPAGERFLVGTVADGQVLAVTPAGDVTEVLRANDQNGMWGIHGLAVDATRNRLWVASAAHPRFSGYSPVDKNRSVLIEFALDTFELIRRYPVPVDGRPHVLSRIAVADNGDVYVADSVLPIVYLRRAETSTLRPFFASQNLVSLRGLALSGDGQRLYVADVEMGIVVVDIEAGESYALQAADTLNLGGIESLGWWQGNLVVVQSGIRPQRLLSLELDPSGMAVTNIAPLAVALDLLDAPGTGTVVGDDFYFFANNQWGKDKDATEPVTIARTALDNAAQIIDPEAERLFEKIEQARQRGEVRPGRESKPDPDARDEPDGSG